MAGQTGTALEGLGPLQAFVIPIPCISIHTSHMRLTSIMSLHSDDFEALLILVRPFKSTYVDLNVSGQTSLIGKGPRALLAPPRPFACVCSNVATQKGTLEKGLQTLLALVRLFACVCVRMWMAKEVLQSKALGQCRHL